MLNSKLMHRTHHTLQVRFEGLPYTREDLLGEYILQCEKINGHPVYVMARPNTTPAVLYRSLGGFWMVGPPEHVAEGRGWLATAVTGLELPSKTGLKWQYFNKNTSEDWIYSDAIICSES